jgi:hypothetical protein
MIVTLLVLAVLQTPVSPAGATCLAVHPPDTGTDVCYIQGLATTAEIEAFEHARGFHRAHHTGRPDTWERWTLWKRVKRGLELAAFAVAVGIYHLALIGGGE